MRALDIIKFSLTTLREYRFRSALTILGLVIGVAMVIILTAFGRGLHSFVIAEFTQFGTNIMGIHPGKKTTLGFSGATISTVRPLSIQDAHSIRQVQGVLDMVPLVQGNARIEANTKQRRANVVGAGPGVPQVWHLKTSSGKFLPSGEDVNPRSFAVLGDKLAKELFGQSSPLGKRVRIGNDRYRVIGVMEKKGQMLGFDMDDTVYIPANKALEMFDREGLMEIDVLYSQTIPVQQVQKNIKKHLIDRHGEEDFTLITQNQMLEKMSSILDILTLAVAVLGGISLFVGAVGIATIMTIAVSERIREIGLLRAIGADKRAIFKIFITEAMILSVAGGLAGIGFGAGTVRIIGKLVPELPVELAWLYVLISVVLCLLIGIFSGVVPAVKAARLDPLLALHSE